MQTREGYKTNTLITKQNIKSFGVIHHTILLKDIQNSWKRKKGPILSNKASDLAEIFFI